MLVCYAIHRLFSDLNERHFVVLLNYFLFRPLLFSFLLFGFFSSLSCPIRFVPSHHQSHILSYYIFHFFFLCDCTQV